MNTSSSSSAIVSRASHCHHTPHAFRPQSGPLTRPIAPNSTISSAAPNRQAVGRGPVLEQMHRAGDAADRDARVHRHPGRHVEVENLLYEQHRRLIRRAGDRDRRVGEHRGGQHGERHEKLSHIYLGGKAERQEWQEPFSQPYQPVLPIPPFLLRHQRLKRPQRQRHEHHVEAQQNRQPHDRRRLVGRRRQRAPTCRGRPQ